MIGSYSTLVEKVFAAGALATGRGVTQAGAYPSANAAVFGVTRFAAAASGEVVAVDLEGTTAWESGGTVTVGGAVAVDATGRCVDYATGVKVGRALTGAGAAGVLCEIQIIPAV